MPTGGTFVKTPFKEDVSNPNTAAGRYSALANLRDAYLERAREISKLTIPSLMPPEGHTGVEDLYQTFQSVGARGVNHLSSKLLLTLLPPLHPFFRLDTDRFVLEGLKQSAGPEAAEEVRSALTLLERAVLDDSEEKADRVAVFELLKHLLVTGNGLLYDMPEDGLKLYHLDRYVVKRDPMGSLLEVVVKESIAPVALPESVRGIIEDKLRQNEDASPTVDVYTWIKRDAKRYKIHQEVMDVVISQSIGSYPLDGLPWYALRMIRIDGEDYGRGFVEEYYGDLKSLEGLTKAIVEGSAAAAKLLILVHPNASTSIKTIAEAPNGAIREGNAEEISFLHMEKFNDFRVALDTMIRIEMRLSQAFLLNSSVQRDAERVTAEEIRLMAQELEDALGGVYSLLTHEFQLPYVRNRLRVLSRKPEWPKLPKGIVKPKIITGLEALSRGHERNSLIEYMATLNATFGEAEVNRRINTGNLMKRLADMDGIDTDGLIKTDEEVAQADQQAQMMQMGQQLGPEIMKMMNTATANGGTPVVE